MSLNLFLVRHGAAEHTPLMRYAGSGTDSDLIEKGECEAREVAEALRVLGAETVWSGPLLRQRKTADIIAKVLQAKRRVTPALNELDFGKWEGLTKEVIGKRWPDTFLGWDSHSQWPNDFFNGTEEEKMLLFDQWIAGLLQIGSDVPVIAVTSNGLLRLLGKRFLGKENGPYGVWTGHGCHLEIGDEITVRQWNTSPQDIA